MSESSDTAVAPTRPKAFWAATGARLLLGVGYIVLASQLPVAIQTAASHDDALFWNRAMQMVDGHWLGTYDQLTLAKGPTFSLFLAANNLLGTSVLVTMALLHVAACWLVTYEVERLGLPRWGSVALFAAILFHPALLPTRVIRDDIYTALALIALAGALRACSGSGRRWASTAVVASGGLGLGLLWATREEGIWVVPGLLLLALLGVVGVRRSRGALMRLGARGGLYVVTAGLVVGGIMATNAAVYGRAVVTEVTDGAFSGAVTALSNIEAGPVVPRVPVTEAMRSQAYEASPAAAELRASLEAPDNRWRGIGCPAGCADYGGGWWMWALRDAVAEQGYYRDASTAAAFYERLTEEVDAACDSGALTCRSGSVPLMPHLTEAQWRELPERLLVAVRLLAVADGTVLGTDNSAEPLAVLRDVRAFLGRPPSTLSATEGRLIVAGWFHDPEGAWMELSCRGAGGAWAPEELARLDSADVAASLGPTAAQSRFSIDLDRTRQCRLDAPGWAGPIELAELVDEGPGPRLLGDATLQVEAASSGMADRPPTWGLAVKDRLTTVYGWFVPVLLVLGLTSLLWGVVQLLRGRRSHVPLLVLALVAWTMVATRSVLLVLVDLTSFDALHAGYVSAGFPLAVIAAVAGLGVLVARPEERGPQDTVAR